VEPQFGPGRHIYFEGFSVDEHGKQHYMDATIAYRQTCLRCIEYLRRYGYDDYQIYLLLGCAPIQGHIAGIVDVRRTPRLYPIDAADDFLSRFPMPVPRWVCRWISLTLISHPIPRLRRRIWGLARLPAITRSRTSGRLSTSYRHYSRTCCNPVSFPPLNELYSREYGVMLPELDSQPCQRRPARNSLAQALFVHVSPYPNSSLGRRSPSLAFPQITRDRGVQLQCREVGIYYDANAERYRATVPPKPTDGMQPRFARHYAG
jgi:hypothetical protein